MSKDTTGQEAVIEVTLEDLVAGGMSPEDAQAYLDTVYTGDKDSNKIPYAVLKINHDKNGFLEDNGVPKAGFVTGYKVNKDTGELVEEGKHFPAVEVVLLKHTAFFDVEAPDKTKYQTEYSQHISAKSATVSELGATVEELRKKGYKCDYTRVQLVLAKEDEGTWSPHIMYIKGIAFNQLLKGLEKFNVSNEALPRTVITLGTVKIMTQHGQRVTSFEITEAQPLPLNDIVATAQTSLTASEEFLNYVDSVNSSNKSPSNRTANGQENPVADDSGVESAKGVI